MTTPLIPTDILDAMHQHYMVTALWSSTDNSDDSGGEPLDKNFDISDIDERDIMRMRDDCMKFYHENRDDIEAVIGKTGPYGHREIDHASIGHDFWLTRNGHGAGFWDGDYPEPQAERLTESAEKFGNCDLLMYKGTVCIA